MTSTLVAPLLNEKSKIIIHLRGEQKTKLWENRSSTSRLYTMSQWVVILSRTDNSDDMIALWSSNQRTLLIMLFSSTFQSSARISCVQRRHSQKIMYMRIINCTWITNLSCITCIITMAHVSLVRHSFVALLSLLFVIKSILGRRVFQLFSSFSLLYYGYTQFYCCLSDSISHFIIML